MSTAALTSEVGIGTEASASEAGQMREEDDLAGQAKGRIKRLIEGHECAHDDVTDQYEARR